MNLFSLLRYLGWEVEGGNLRMGAETEKVRGMTNGMTLGQQGGLHQSESEVKMHIVGNQFGYPVRVLPEIALHAPVHATREQISSCM